MANEVMRDVEDPQTGVSVADRRRARIEVNGSSQARDELQRRSDLRISPLGSGSDYSPFLQHLGIASLNISFGGKALTAAITRSTTPMNITPGSATPG